jgi:hypothetical protein
VANVAVTTLPEFSILMRMVVVWPPASIRPRSTANGPTPASRLPQFCWSVTVACSTPNCRNR